MTEKPEDAANGQDGRQACPSGGPLSRGADRQIGCQRRRGEQASCDSVACSRVGGAPSADHGRLGADGMAVSREHAVEKGLTLGSTVPVMLPTGEVEFTVRALYDGSEWFGNQFVDTAAFDAYLPDSLDSRVYASGTDAAMEDATAAYPTAEVLDREAFFDGVGAEIDQILGIVYAMLVLAVIIALLGVANTLGLSIYERTREIGLLRAVGMTRSQIRSTIRGEAIVIALFGTLGGLGVGAFFGWATVHALSDEGIDTLTLPIGRLAIITMLAALAGALTATLPARRAARLKVLDALAMQ